jgi:hypothetical protein
MSPKNLYNSLPSLFQYIIDFSIYGFIIGCSIWLLGHSFEYSIKISVGFHVIIGMAVFFIDKVSEIRFIKKSYIIQLAESAEEAAHPGFNSDIRNQSTRLHSIARKLREKARLCEHFHHDESKQIFYAHVYFSAHFLDPRIYVILCIEIKFFGLS